MDHSTLPLSGRQAERFLALQQQLVPRSQHFNVEQTKRGLELVNTLLLQQSPQSQRKLGLFLRLIDLFSLCLARHSFRHASTTGQQRVLRFLFDSPVGLLRKGFWGLNTLARYGVYGQPDLYQEIGYVLRSNPDAQ